MAPDRFAVLGIKERANTTLRSRLLIKSGHKTQQKESQTHLMETKNYIMSIKRSLKASLIKQLGLKNSFLKRHPVVFLP